MRRRSRSSSFPYWFFLFLILGGGAVWLYNSTTFEQNPPIVDAPSQIFWNLQKPIQINISDDEGIKRYAVYLLQEEKELPLETTALKDPLKEVSFEFVPPKHINLEKEGSFELEVEAVDSSLWRFFSGNVTRKKIIVTVDTTPPVIEVVANSKKILKGGAGLVIFKVQEVLLQDLTLSNGTETFKAQPFYQKGYYASLFPWPITESRFEAKIMATDAAGNSASLNVNFIRGQRTYKESRIPLKDDFINGKISSLITEIGERPLDSFERKVERFTYINEDIRTSNEETIKAVGEHVESTPLPSDFSLLSFYPLKKAAAVAGFGDHRIFIYQGKPVSHSYHMGFDLASVKEAPVYSSNSGKVLFADFLGIYGNLVIIDHGMGLMSLYAHLSEIHVQKGSTVEKDAIIGKTGRTGLALGDHLHFGTLVQGVEVHCAEWMDPRWIKENITDIIQKAKGVIDSKKSS